MTKEKTVAKNILDIKCISFVLKKENATAFFEKIYRQKSTF